MTVVSDTMCRFLQHSLMCMLDCGDRTLAQQTVLTFDWKRAFVLSQPKCEIRRNESLTPLPPCGSEKYQGTVIVVSWCLARLKQNGKSWTEAARGEPHYDPLFKIWPVIDTLITQFQDVYSPEEELTVDEAICPFWGRIFFRVYIKGKPH
jgi:hypothetical protein